MRCNLERGVGVGLLLGILVCKITCDPPPHQEYAKRARYDVNQVNWGTFTTIAAADPVKGLPFPRAESMSDGPVGAGTGVPYFYLMQDGGPMTNIKHDSNVTIGITETQLGGLLPCQITPFSDPEMPTCARVLLFGHAYVVTDKKELSFAKKTLFQRHPVMPNLPASHNFEVVGVKLTYIWILDYFGGAVYVDLKDYFSVNSTAVWQD